MRKLIVLALILVSVGIPIGAVPADEAEATGPAKMYWTGGGSIWRANLDGSGAEEVVPGVSGWDIALDVGAGEAYLTGGASIRRVNLDGGTVEDVVTGLDDTWYIALDVAGGKMYWTEPFAAKIQRANLDGSGVQELILDQDCLVTANRGCPVRIALDLAGGKMYWNRVLANLQRANLDGSEAETLASSWEIPGGIALDLGGVKMYSTEYIPQGPGHWYEEGRVRRTNLNGTGSQTLVSQESSEPAGIALDVAGGKVYWADPGLEKLRRANLDGSDAEDLITGSTVGKGIALDLPGPPVGGVAELARVAETPLERPVPSGSGEFLAGILAAGVITLGGAARWVRRRTRATTRE